MADIGVHQAKGWEEGAVIRLLVEGQGNWVTELLFVAGTHFQVAQLYLLQVL